jgi:hypothetical protein
MAKEIQLANDAGITAYALVRNQIGQVWNGSTFVNYVTANLNTYAIVMTEQGTASGYYTADFPPVLAELYSIVAFKRIGGTPAEGDPLIASGTFYWDGTKQTNFIEHAGLITGVVDDASPTTSSFKGDASLSAIDDFYLGSVMAFTEGALRSISRRVNGYVGATRTFSFAFNFPVPPADEDTFIIIGRIE